ncbi:MAG: hypothetical protein HPY57_14860 [Ignavibacteria bacterium]|nr:hypothetical protein [Ignavibacteria bacterium]
MKYLKKVNEFSLYDDSSFQFYTQDIKDVTINFTDKNVDYMRGTASVKWFLDFDFKGDKGVEIYPVIQLVTIYLYKDVYIDDDGNTEEQYEEINIEHNNTKVEIDGVGDNSISILYYPSSINYDYDKKEAVVFF